MRFQDGNSINVFLYHTMPNAAWRNADLPGQVRAGEVGHPPLALNLHYLITAYGTDESDLPAQVALGRAMRVLHDRAELTARDIRNFTGNFAGNSLDQQVDSVRITPDPLSVEDLTRLWSTFKSEYRVSAAYLASVVLIESQRPTRSNPPVVKRGPNDAGINSRLDFEPFLERIEYRRGSRDVESPGLIIRTQASDPESWLRLTGLNFPKGGRLIIRNPRADTAAQEIVTEFPVQRLSDVEATVDVSSTGVQWSVGSLMAEVEYDRSADNSHRRASNAMPIAVPPRLRITDDNTGVLTQRATVDGKSILTVHSLLAIHLRQRVCLVLSGKDNAYSYQLLQEPDLTGSGQTAPKFDVSNVQPGKYWLRLRVDGVDSLLMKPMGTSFEFDKRFEVTL